jgi:hypothetical protein
MFSAIYLTNLQETMATLLTAFAESGWLCRVPGEGEHYSIASCLILLFSLKQYFNMSYCMYVCAVCTLVYICSLSINLFEAQTNPPHKKKQTFLLEPRRENKS